MTLHAAMRALRRRPGPAGLNVASLAVGMAACLLIGLWVHHELSYDTFHDHADRTYRVVQQYKLSAEHDGTTFSLTPRPLAQTMRKRPEVEATIRVARRPSVVQRGENAFREDDLFRADSNFFDAFTLDLLQGTPATVLQSPDAVVLTRDAARRYFPGVSNPVGRTLTIDGTTHRVTGIAAPPPDNTHLQFDVVARMVPDRELVWMRNRTVTYVRLTPDSDPGVLERAATRTIVDRKGAANDPERDYRIFLQPLADVHLQAGLPAGISLTARNLRYAFGGAGNLSRVWLFGALAVLILGIACVNFMNLATAHSADRAREVGARKALGAGRSTLARQFLAESIFTSGAALFVAIGLAHAGLPILNSIAGTSLSLSALVTPPILIGIGAGTIVTGLLAGSYPAIVLSRFQPSAVLRGDYAANGGRRLRQGLVTAQFAASIALLAGTGIIYQQLNYLQNRDLGFAEDTTLIVELDDTVLRESAPPIQALTSLSGVEHATRAHGIPGENFASTTYRRPDAPNSRARLFTAWGDYDYVETLGLTVTSGRDFSREHPSDSSAVLINEAAVRLLFGTEDPIGKSIATTGPQPRERTVVGVVEDFNYQSLHEEVEPMMIAFLEFPSSWPTPDVMALRLRPDAPPSTINIIERVWTAEMPGAPFQSAYLADLLDAQYRTDQQFGRLFRAFAILAFLIAGLGLFGLAAHAVERRTREVAIRKTLGATASHVLLLFSRDFLPWVGLACVMAIPISYAAFNTWLGEFAYRVSISPWLFVGAAAVALLVAAMTTGTQAARLLRVDPAKNLQRE